MPGQPGHALPDFVAPHILSRNLVVDRIKAILQLGFIALDLISLEQQVHIIGLFGDPNTCV